MTQNVIGKFSYRIKQRQNERDSVVNQPITHARNAFLGDNNGVITFYNGKKLKKNYVVIRDSDGNLSIAYNKAVELWPNTPIIVGYDPLKPTTFQVLGTRDYITNTPNSAIPAHHETHEWPASDTVFIHSEQFLPGLLLANKTFNVKIYPFFFRKNDGTRGYIPGTTLDLEAYVPATGAQAFTIVASDDQTLQVVAGSTQPSLNLISMADFPAILDSTLHEIWGIRLYAGQTVIQQTEKVKDTFDFRAVSSGGNGGGHVIVSPLEEEMPQRVYLKFTGNGVTASDDESNETTIITVQQTLEYGMARWSGAAGQDTFDLPDYAETLEAVTINGVQEDPLLYTLGSDGSQFVLDSALPFDAVVASRYQLKAL